VISKERRRDFKVSARSRLLLRKLIGIPRANSGNFRICRPTVLRVLRVINRGIMIVISITNLNFPSTPFCPKDTDFKRAFGHP
jgi:hypothetical protein